MLAGMKWLFHPLLLLIAKGTASELAKQVEYLKAKRRAPIGCGRGLPVRALAAPPQLAEGVPARQCRRRQPRHAALAAVALRL